MAASGCGEELRGKDATRETTDKPESRQEPREGTVILRAAPGQAPHASLHSPTKSGAGCEARRATITWPWRLFGLPVVSLGRDTVVGTLVGAVGSSRSDHS